MRASGFYWIKLDGKLIIGQWIVLYDPIAEETAEWWDTILQSEQIHNFDLDYIASAPIQFVE